MDVYITVDVEIWCDGWNDLDRKFVDAFNRYIYGRTKDGDYGLPWILRTMQSHGISGTFFTEALFAGRFGLAPLEEIVGLIQQFDQDIELHLHTEWADELRLPGFAPAKQKHQYLREFDRSEQRQLIGLAKSLLVQAKAPAPVAFRAGSFGLSADTLPALRDNDIRIDSSYNVCFGGLESGIAGHCPLTQPQAIQGVVEYPMSFFVDGFGQRRHAQIGACSFAELRDALQRAHAQGWQSFVMLFHNFEALDGSKTRADRVVVRRFTQLCQYLEQHRDMFMTRSMATARDAIPSAQPQPFSCNPLFTYGRYWEQGMRHLSP